jgi:hypothetical protein
MKSFSQFFQEAVETSASAEAKKLGLTGDGHGGWYDKNGEFTAKTVGGKLKFYNQNQVAGQKDPSIKPKVSAPPTQVTAPQAVAAGAQQQSVAQQTAQTSATQQQVPPEQQMPADQAQQELPQEEPQYNGVVVVFGRFNPPTVGHEKLLQKAAKEAEKKGYQLRVYPSRSHDPKKNPLDPTTKISYMRQMFPDYADSIIDDKSAKTIFNVLRGANEEGATNMTIMVGGDRLSEFQGLSHKYNGDLYNYDNLEVVSAGDRDPDADDTSGMSASKMRVAAAEGDFLKFAKGIPNSLGNMEKMELYNALRRSMGINENTELWEVAPKFDADGLRDAYISEEIYTIGSFVENMNTGLSGQIIRRGTNYVICVTEEDVMFKSWLKDLVEYE